MDTESKQYVEVGRFDLNPGVTAEAFLQAESDVRNGVITTQPGYQGREMYRDADGSWMVIIRWADREAAEAWTPIFMTSKEGQALASLLDFAGGRQEHYTLMEP